MIKIADDLLEMIFDRFIGYLNAEVKIIECCSNKTACVRILNKDNGNMLFSYFGDNVESVRKIYKKLFIGFLIHRKILDRCYRYNTQSISIEENSYGCHFTDIENMKLYQFEDISCIEELMIKMDLLGA